MFTKVRKGSRRTTLAVALVALLFLFIFQTHVGNALRSIIALVVGTAPEAYDLLPRDVLASRLVAAERTISRTRYQALLYQSLAEENRELKALLALPRELSYAAGEVIARPPKTHYDTILVAVGSDVEVRPGDHVLAYGIPVGEVTSITQRTVTAILYSAPDATIDARAGRPSAIIVMKGLGGGAFTFTLPAEVTLNPGDRVEMVSGAYPIAIVEKVVRAPDVTTATVFARSPVNYFDIRFVEFMRAQ